MNGFGKLRIFISVALLMCASRAWAEERHYNLPKGSAAGAPHFIDNCLQWGRQCGEPAANQFCQNVGFERAKNFRLGNSGANLPTVVLGTGQVCNSPNCVALAAVTCARSDTKVYPLPRASGGYVDNCLVWAQQCGRPAADEFCRREGYGYAKTYRKGRPGRHLPTKVLGGGQTCNDNGCVAFTRVECSVGRRPTATPIPWNAIESVEASVPARKRCHKMCYDRHVGAFGTYLPWRKEKRKICVAAECATHDKDADDAEEIISTWASTNNCEYECSEECRTVFQRITSFFSLSTTCTQDTETTDN